MKSEQTVNELNEMYAQLIKMAMRVNSLKFELGFEYDDQAWCETVSAMRMSASMVHDMSLGLEAAVLGD